LCCRKLIMNIAVNKGAEENKTFAFYVEYLARENWIPPGNREWVDHVRQMGNEATHEIKLMTNETSEELLNFLTIMLKFMYEFPEEMNKKLKASPSI
jgi:hypothetical protein